MTREFGGTIPGIIVNTFNFFGAWRAFSIDVSEAVVARSIWHGFISFSALIVNQARPTIACGMYCGTFWAIWFKHTIELSKFSTDEDCTFWASGLHRFDANIGIIIFVYD
jgi:hypothetical protein